MPKRHNEHEIKVINKVVSAIEPQEEKTLEIATTNKGKLEEFIRLLPEFTIINKKLDIEEIQSSNRHKVISNKAKAGWEANGYNPVLVEDVSVHIKGLNDLPGPYVKDFTESVQLREMISKEWLSGKDRNAQAVVLLGLFDGLEIHIWEGLTGGKISEAPKGNNGFGWDDIFIPEGQPNNEERTFAEMSSEEKDKYSMRRKAIENLKDSPVFLNYPIYMLDEPYRQELDRVNLKALKNDKAVDFAYKLEFIEEANEPNVNFEAPENTAIKMFDSPFYRRYTVNEKTSSLGLIATNIDYNKINLFENGDPMIFQIGPERRHLALAQRAEHFLREQKEEKIALLEELNKNGQERPPRSQRRHRAVEHAIRLSTDTYDPPITTIGLKELGYKKLSSEKEVSRSKIAETGLFTKIGKYYRAPYTIGSMPPVSGWRDVLVMGAISHMLVFTSRNSIHARDAEYQAQLIKDAARVIRSLDLTPTARKFALNNLGAALGCGNIREEVKNAKILNKKAGVKVFRIYTINSDPRVVELSRALRKEFGDKIEIFTGQIADKKQALQLVSDDIRVDGLIFGHGGGRQCTSAANGMAITTLEELYSIITDPRFDDTTIITEGGVGTSVGPMFILGVDAISYNQQMVRGGIETGEIYFQHKNGKICQPYHGSASPPTMLIEYENDKKNRISASGRVEKVEGKPGYLFYDEKVNSMAFHIDRYKHYAARMLADLGVESLSEMHQFVHDYEKELLRMVSTEAAVTASAYRV